MRGGHRARRCDMCWAATSRPWCTRAVAYARQKDRLQTWAVTASVGPGSTNMLTGAALATINRLPVLLLPADTFATRVSAPVLQELELPPSTAMSPSTTRSSRCRGSSTGCGGPNSCPSALLGAMRVLTDPVETGAATIAIPQDVQAEALDWPESLFAERTWHVARPLPERSVIAQAAEVIRVRAAAADRRRRRRHLLRRQRRAGGVLRADRHPGGGEPGRQGLAPLRPSAVGRRDRLDRNHRRQRAGHRGRRRHRDRHPLQRFHQRVADRVQQPRRPVRQHQRRLVRRGEAGRPVASSPTPARPSRRWPTRWPTTRSATTTARGQPNSPRSGTTPSPRPTASRTTAAP